MVTAQAVKISHTEPEGALPQGRLSNGAAKASSCIGAGSLSVSPDDLSEQELRAWRGLLRAHASLAKMLDAELEERHGLPMSSYEVLHRLAGAEMDRMRMCDLAEQAQMSRSGLTRLVDRLERDGLLERCSCEHDARGAYACLTATGRERLGEARSTHRAVVREHFHSRFSDQELSSLAELWERIAPCCGPSC
jgi:DNA-binding MarR family transcriptional regulator